MEPHRPCRPRQPHPQGTRRKEGGPTHNALKPAWILLLAISTLASGCLTESSSTEQGVESEPAAQDAPIQGPVGPLEVRWEGCHGLVGTFELPAELAKGIVPPEFHHWGLSAYTRSFLFEAVDCERFATDGRVLPDAGYFHLLARVAPRDDSWADPGVASHYSVLLLGAGTDVADALALVGAPAEYADAARSTQEVPAAADLHRWTYAAAGRDVEVEYATSHQPTAERDHRLHQWYAATDGFHRIDATKDYGVDGLAAEAGALRAASATGVPQPNGSIPWTGQAYAHLDEVWSAHDKLFPPKEA